MPKISRRPLGLVAGVLKDSYLFEIDGDGDVFEFWAIVQGRTLPPLVGAIDRVTYRVSFARIGAQIVTYATPALATLHHLAEFLTAVFAARRIRRYDRFGGQIEDGGP